MNNLHYLREICAQPVEYYELSLLIFLIFSMATSLVNYNIKCGFIRWSLEWEMDLSDYFISKPLYAIILNDGMNDFMKFSNVFLLFCFF